MKYKILMAGALAALSYSASSFAATDSPEYASDWWHQSVNVVGSYHTRFGPQLNNDVYLEYEAFAKKDWFDFYGYLDVPKFFGAGNSNDKGIWDKGSPLFMEIEPRFSIDKLTNTDLSFGPFKEWYFANNYIYDMGHNSDNRQNTWYMGLGTDIDTHSDVGLSLNVYAKYQWENYGAPNENSWDGYRFKVKYFVPITTLWGGNWVTLASPTLTGAPTCAIKQAPRAPATLSHPATFSRWVTITGTTQLWRVTSTTAASGLMAPS